MSKNKTIVLGTYNKKKSKSYKGFFYIFLVFILLIGVTYQWYSIFAHANQYGRVGKLVEVNGVNMHLYTGGEGNKTFVLASDIGTAVPYVSLYPLHSELAKIASVAVYDKPGYGWSGLTKAPRDIDSITSEIHALLENSQQSAPYILVGHAMGSLEILRFAQLYPDEVEGIVLIDGASPAFSKDFNNIMIVDSFLVNLSRNTGLLRLGNRSGKFQNTISVSTSLSEDLQAVNAGLALEKIWNRNALLEKLNLNKNGEIVFNHGALGDIPLYIITSKANPYNSWNKSQTELLKLSTQSFQSYIQGSVNTIETDDVPDILATINELLLSLEEE